MHFEETEQMVPYLWIPHQATPAEIAEKVERLLGIAYSPSMILEVVGVSRRDPCRCGCTALVGSVESSCVRY
jgi:hypothetical protein